MRWATMEKTTAPRTTLAPDIAKVLRRLHYPLDVMLLCVRWHVAYSLNLRDLEENVSYRLFSSLSSYCDTTVGGPTRNFIHSPDANRNIR
jgi:transposase-like protein